MIDFVALQIARNATEEQFVFDRPRPDARPRRQKRSRFRVVQFLRRTTSRGRETGAPSPLGRADA